MNIRGFYTFLTAYLRTFYFIWIVDAPYTYAEATRGGGSACMSRMGLVGLTLAVFALLAWIVNFLNRH
jgi:hypothetical protein